MSEDAIIRIKAFTGPQEFGSLLELAKTDKHGVLYPTDVVWKNGERVGWFSAGRIPTLMSWLHTTKLSSRDSLQMINTMENIIYRTGAPGLIVPSPEGSGPHDLLEKLGYTNLGKQTLFFKEF